MASVGRKVNPDEIRKVKSYGRQSQNMEDFRDTYTGPKKTRGKTRRVQAENTRGKLDEVVQNNGGMTQDKKISDVTLSPETNFLNSIMNDRRMKMGVQVGQVVKNRDLKAPKQVGFFKHKVVNN